MQTGDWIQAGLTLIALITLAFSIYISNKTNAIQKEIKAHNIKVTLFEKRMEIYSFITHRLTETDYFIKKDGETFIPKLNETKRIADMVRFLFDFNDRNAILSFLEDDIETDIILGEIPDYRKEFPIKPMLLKKATKERVESLELHLALNSKCEEIVSKYIQPYLDIATLDKAK